jgi:hypothetical protein
MAIKLAEYQTPEGYYDLPYVHVYDGDALTDAATYRNVNVGISDNEAGFALRQIMGRDKLAARAQFRDSFAPLAGGDNGVAFPRTYPVAPERFITPAGMLNMDLYTVLRANRAALGVTIFFAQIAFQGVKRYLQPPGGGVIYPGKSDYQYVERPFSYQQQVVVNWAGTDTQPRKFALPITEGCDFELQRITIVRSRLAGAATNVIPDSEIKLMLFDQHGRQLSNAPVLDVYLNDAADATTHFYNPVFPVPAVLYRRQSFIRLEVTSLLLAAQLPATYEVYLQGVRRFQAE